MAAFSQEQATPRTPRIRGTIYKRRVQARNRWAQADKRRSAKITKS
jgi:hypothetical protein